MSCRRLDGGWRRALLALPWLGATCVAIARPQAQGPDLAVIVMRADPDSRPLVAPGQTITVGVAVGNINGDSDAHSVVLTVKLPAGLKLQRSNPAANKVGAESLVWNLGTIAAHAPPETFELNMAVANNAPSELTVSANVSSSDRDKYLENNSDSLSIIVRPAASDLIVQSTLDAVALTVGEPTKFDVDIENQGNVAALASELKAVLPQGVSLKSSEPVPSTTGGNTIIWKLGDIEPGATRVVALTVGVDPSLVPSPPGAATDPKDLLTFTFDASTTTTAANPADSRLEIERQVVMAGFDLKTWLGLEGTEPSRLPVGKDVTYAITYGNFGNVPASKASVSLSLGEGLNFVSAEPAPARTDKSDRFGGGVLTWDAGDLRVGQSGLIKCHVHVTSVPDYGSLVMATVSAPGTDINPANNSAFFYGYPPATAGAGALGKALGGGQTGHASVLWRLLLLLALGAGGWFVWRKMRQPAQSP